VPTDRPQPPNDDLNAALERANALPDAPDPDNPPQIPELLRTPVQRPASMTPKPSALSGFGDIGRALAIGLDFLFAAAAGGFVGYLIDRWLGSLPTGTVVGAGLGFLAGTVRLIQRLNRDDPAKRPPKRPPGAPPKPPSGASQGPSNPRN
jgi:ATP synthase protein I